MKNIPIIQPNKVTNARYQFSAVQKNILYHIIGKMQDKMEKQKTLFEGTVFSFKLTDLEKNGNYAMIRREVKKMLQMPVEYEVNREDGLHDIITTLIASVDHTYKSDEIKIEVTSKAMEFLSYIGQGFTKYQKTIAINLSSIYAKRMYELCNRFKDVGGFSYSLKEFRELMGLNEKYQHLSELKKRVLEVAKKQLKDSADVWFEYDLKKINSRSFNHINVAIHSNEISTGIGETAEIQAYMFRLISLAYPAYKDNTALKISETLIETGKAQEIYKKLKRLDDKLSKGEHPAKIANIIKKLLREDYGLK
jgi:plasmid replication initiation protein